MLNANHSSLDSRRSAVTARGGMQLLITGLRLAIYSALAVLERLVVFIFGLLALIGLALVGFFKVLLGLPHFPTVTVLTMSLVCTLIITAYYAVMRLLLPD